jgi:formylglycine-generating enzyme required for sulfatase activity
MSAFKILISCIGLCTTYKDGLGKLLYTYYLTKKIKLKIKKHKSMKYLSLFIALLLLGIVLGASSSKKSLPAVLDFDKRFVKVDDNFYVDKYEVSVEDYQIFLNDKKGKGEDCTLLMYDSTQWRRRFSWNSPMMDFYFNSEAYRSYPVVCITYTAANEFCKWLTEKYHSNPNRKYKQVKFRLPTEQEFIKAAISNYDHTKIFYPWGNNGLYEKGEKRCNFFEMRQEDLDFKQQEDLDLKYGYAIVKYHNIQNIITFFNFEIEPVTSYKPNPYGVFNIVGNVSEMIQEEHIAMGGDWMSTGYNVKITSKKQYENSDATVGFRVYMEIIEI